jgi:hypothetical protein
MLRGGGSDTAPLDANAAAVATPAPESNGISAVLDGTENAAIPENAAQTAAPTDSSDQLKREEAKTAAAEARLAEMKRAQARAAQAQARGGTAATPAKPDKRTVAEVTATPSTGGVSAGKLAQLDGIVDDARAMAKSVMRSSNSSNAALARNYDANLKTLKASARGVSSDKELDRLIAQAKQTRAYVQFLTKQQ